MNIEMKGINKSFATNQVLKNAGFYLRDGEIHALMGENGAGKSTLMKILTGVYTKDSGTILVDGQEVHYKSPQEAEKAGIVFIYQELNVLFDLTVEQNLFMGKEITKHFGVCDRKAMRQKAQEVMDRMGVHIPVNAVMSDLSVGQQQMVEICKALMVDAKVLIMDEPTAALTQSETEVLFQVIQSLKAKGVSIVYISHRMEEIFEIGDRITVFRDGHSVATLPVAEVCERELIKLMIGSEVVDKVTERRSRDNLVPGLEARGIKSRKYDKPVDFTAYKGEIVGIFGLVGAGRTELARVLFGIDPSDCGEIIKDGRPIKLSSPADAIKNRIGMIPEDRKEYGLITRHDVQNNLTLVKLRELPWFLRTTRREEELTDEYIQKLSIATKSRYQLLERLSGGNQQKVVIAKWISMELDVIILDEPTRGVDVKAKAEIYELMRSLAESGKCIIMISSDLPEILRVSHRVVVMHDGAITLDSPTAELDQEKILYAALN